MTTARGLLRRLLLHGRLDPAVVSQRREQRAVENRLEAAQARLKQSIPPVEEGAAGDQRPDQPAPG